MGHVFRYFMKKGSLEKAIGHMFLYMRKQCVFVADFPVIAERMSVKN